MMATAYYQADWRRFDDMVRRAQEAGPIAPYLEANIEAGRHLRAPSPQSTKRFLEHAREQLVRTKTLTIGTLMTLCNLGLKDQVFELIDAASFAYMFDPEQPWAAWDFPGSFFSLSYNKPMMRDPRFPRLCAKFGLCDYWVKTDRWPDCAEEGVLPYDFKAECRRLAAANQVTPRSAYDAVDGTPPPAGA
jgi:hypothetical protein